MNKGVFFLSQMLFLNDHVIILKCFCYDTGDGRESI